MAHTAPSSAFIGSDDRFPAPEFAEAVLGPGFAHAQAHHLAHLLQLHRAHGVMLAEQHLLTGEEITALLRALDATERGLMGRGPSPYTGEHEDMFFFVESELRRHVGVETAGRLHTGRSRNDIDHTLFKMRFRDELDRVTGRLADLIEAVIARAEADKATIICAYTHGQPAQPSTYGHYLGAVIEALLRSAERLEGARMIVDLCPMGAAAITTTGFPLDRHRMAALLGFRDILRNSYGCIASADYTAGLFCALKVLALDLGRFAQDMAFWTSFEVGQLRFSDGFVQISSIMPQKRNPVPCEHMRLMASLCVGRCDAVTTALHNTPFTDMNDNEHEVHGQGYAAFAIAERVLLLMAAVIRSASIDEARARANIERSYATITELADTLVREERLPFVQAHHVAADLARLMQAGGQTLSTVPYDTFSAAFAAIAGRAPTLTESRFRQIVTPDHFIAVRGLPGGPAPGAMADSLALYREAAARVRARLAAHAAARSEAEALLASAMSRFEA
ncbi:argininosuccinate lyase [Salinarimonas soli]|uniref:argininosuccinate lyase n=1 Tax=Salinarimonas soli TaxID=1638099 RepID=A0A5B2V791_9HYPH|nr:argininosuccinate lyase [Salinarimonas soli]KAA2234854.1 argininosuccinate lyase [Salinarimonas soli]